MVTAIIVLILSGIGGFVVGWFLIERVILERQPEKEIPALPPYRTMAEYYANTDEHGNEKTPK